jgi:hypothetical protein
MTTTREEMDAAIKSLILPHLRAMGFKGSLPHLRRLRGNAADLIAFQFRSSGGAFVVEIGRVSPDGFDFHGRHIPLAKANVTYLAHRHRLGAPVSSRGDHWFTFADRAPQDVARDVIHELERDDVWALVDSWPVLGE